ncbi:uncharacterized protein LOC112128284 isoform X1 [Cimex lectularius]|uniref:Uncharacterized protein n=1 Tax=Cimex lectularius TaxID=79782 RepID=A0A8I6SQJ3_CIMLE|nr:uncharacterized protein LOC112128284 isoform X1 [Cimex lectularius]
MRSIVSLVLIFALVAGTCYGQPVKCQCNCPGSNLICARDSLKSKETETFKNICQLNCFNCTSGKSKHFILLHKGECKND